MMRPIRRLLDLGARQFRLVDEEAGALAQPGAPDFRAGVVLVVSAAVIVALNYVVLSGDFQRWLADGLLRGLGLGDGLGEYELMRRRRLLEHVSWALGCVSIYLFVPALTVKLVLRGRLRDFGLTTRGYLRHAWIYALLFIPVAVPLVIVSRSPAFLATYPFYKNPESLGALLAWELSYAAQFVALEFFFRGFMIHGLKHRFGTAAIWIMVIPYCMIHFAKPGAEAVGALVAGTVLGLLSLRTGSVLGGATIHIAVAWSMDALSLYHKGMWPHLF